MHRVISLLVCTFVVVGCQVANLPEKPNSNPQVTSLPNGIRLVAQSQPGAGELSINYRKYLLDNGLTLVLHHDKSDPLVHVDVTYHVGSSREEPGKSGFAHFFEHMMFQGSLNVADEQHFKMVTEAGGNMNGTTNSDRTNYFQTVPANQLERMLWLEADRMGFLLPAVTQDKFEVQRETVKNERAQRVDNQPYGLRSERISEALYPTGHPYSWPVIGYVEDLDRVGVADLKQFFQRWYGPNNAVLTIGGDFDEAQVLEWVVKYFGVIPRGPEVELLEKAPVSLEQDRYLLLEDDVHLPLLQLTFPTVYARHEDEAALDVLADILGGGKSSLFYKNLVKDGFAVHASVNHPCRELACQFELITLPNPQKLASLADLEQIVRATLQEFEQRGVTQDDLQRTKASIKAGTVFGLQSVAGKVGALAFNETFDGEPDMVQYDLERYGNVRAADVMRVYNTYIKGKAAVVLSIVPRGDTQIAASQDNFQIPPRQFSASTAGTYEAGEAIADSFDRSVIPPVQPNPPLAVPDAWRTTLKNGIRVIGLEANEVPTVSMTLNLEGGPLLDPKGKRGLAAMTALMLQESTLNFSNEEMANELAKLGSSISIQANGRFTSVQVNSIREHFAATLALLREKLFSPAFLPADFNRLKQRRLQALQQSLKNPQSLSSMAQLQVLYGKDNILGVPDSGNLQNVSAITLEDVRGFYRDYYTAHMANIIIVGDISQDAALPKLGFLEQWRSDTYAIPAYTEFPDLSEPKLYFVDDPGAAQTVVSYIKHAMPYDALGEYFKANLMNFPLGGMFNSRINLNLREDKGYTYGARTRFSGGKTLGRFIAGAAVNKESTYDAVKELSAEISGYQQNGMTGAELAFLKNAYTQGDALKFETPFNKAGFLRHMEVYGLTAEYPHQQNKIIAEIKSEELNQLAKKHLELASMQLLMVGDWQTLQQDIERIAKEQGRQLVRLELR